MNISTYTSIYIHWPFCKTKCPYCDFNSHVRNSIDHYSYLTSYIKEIEYYQDYLKNKKIISIFFGGGTPTLAQPFVIEEILSHISKNYILASDIEITLEANPTSVEASNFAQLARGGINRLSLGIQSLRASNLQFLGREHTIEESFKAIELAQKYFPRYSLDLIYALPNQSLNQWEDELNEALTYTRNHISLYQLTIEKGTRFFTDFKQGKFCMPHDNLAARMYELTEKIVTENGYKAYEVSNYCKEGYACRHNMQYWQYQDYLGIGPGAHGRITKETAKVAIRNIASPENWLSQVLNLGHGIGEKEVLNSQIMFTEKILMQIRTSEGVRCEDLDQEKALMLIENGLLEKKDKHFIPTLKGRLVLNSMVDYLLTTKL